MPKRLQPTGSSLTVTEIRTDQHKQIWLRCINPNRWICLHRGSQSSSAIPDKVGPKRDWAVHSVRAAKILKQLADGMPTVF
jgi:hypothetical protein